MNRILLIFVASFSICASASGADILYFSTSGITLFPGYTSPETIDFSVGFTNTIQQSKDNVHFQLHGQPGETFLIDFAGPGGPDLNIPLAVGTYLNAARYPFEGSAPGLAFSGNFAYAANTVTGQFEVLEASYDGQGNVLKFAADFVQNLNGDPTTVEQGSIRFNSDIPITVPEPSTFALLSLGAISLLSIRRRKFA